MRRALTLIELMISTAVVLLISAILVSSFYSYLRYRISLERRGEEQRAVRALELELSTTIRRATSGTLETYDSPPAVYMRVGDELYAYKFDPLTGSVLKSTDGGSTWRRLPEVKGLEAVNFKTNSSGTIAQVEVSSEGKSFTFGIVPRVVEERRTAWLKWKKLIPVTVTNNASINLEGPFEWSELVGSRALQRNAVKVQNDTDEPMIDRTVAVVISSLDPITTRTFYDLIPVIYNSSNTYRVREIPKYWVGPSWWEIKIIYFGWFPFPYPVYEVLLFIRVPYIPPRDSVTIVFYKRPSQVPPMVTREALDLIGDYGSFRIRRTVAAGSWACQGRDFPKYILGFDPIAYFPSIQDYLDTDPATVRIKVNNPFDLCMGVEKYNGRTNGRWRVAYLGFRSGLWWLPYVYEGEDPYTGYTAYDLGGVDLEVAQFWTTSSYRVHKYLRQLSDLPVNIHHLQTYYGTDPAHTRANMDTSSPYAYLYLKIEEIEDLEHTLERVAFSNLTFNYPNLTSIDSTGTWFESSGVWLQGNKFQYNSTSLSNVWRRISYDLTEPGVPSVIAKISTENGRDNSEERLRNETTTTFDFRIEETDPNTEPHPAVEWISWVALFPRGVYETYGAQHSLPIMGLEGWMEDYSYSSTYVYVSGSAALVSDMEDFQFPLTIDTSTLISNGDLRPDGADLRVLDEDLSTPLPYWIEDGTLNTTSTRIWVRYPFRLPYGASRTIYIAYGNPDVENTISSFDAVFTRDEAFKGDGYSDPSLIAWYPFNTSSYTDDYSGNYLSLTVESGSPFWVNTTDGGAWNGKSITFSRGGYVCLPTGTTLSLSDGFKWYRELEPLRWLSFNDSFSISFWLYVKGTDGDVVKLTDSSVGDIVSISLAGGVLSASMLLMDGSTVSVSGRDPLSPGWHHVSLVYDGLYLNLYQDGSLVRRSSVNDYMAWGGTGVRRLVIGGTSLCIDDLAIRSKPLSELEVLARTQRRRSTLLAQEPSVSVGSTLDGFAYKRRVPITITNSTSSPLTDIQVKLKIDTAYLLAKGYISLTTDNRIKGLRFTSSDGVSTLPYWVVPGTENTNSTEIFIRVDSLAVGDNTIYMYYDQDIGTPTVGDSHDATFDIIGEAGRTYLNTNWKQVEVRVTPRSVLLRNEVAGSSSHESYAGDVLIASPVTVNEYQWNCTQRTYSTDFQSCGQAVVRFYSKGDPMNTFVARLEEYPAQDYYHKYELVSWFRFRPGKWLIGSNTPLEARWTDVNGDDTGSWIVVSPSPDLTFTGRVLLLAHLNSYKEHDYKSLGAHTRTHPLTTSSYQITIEEQGSASSDTSYRHAYEKVATVFTQAITAAPSSVDAAMLGNQFSIGLTSRSYNHNWQTVSFPFSFSSAPVTVAKIATQYGPDNSEERLRNVSTIGFEFKIEETPYFNPLHVTERVVWIASLEGRIYGVKYIPSGRLTYPDITESYIASSEEIRR